MNKDELFDRIKKMNIDECLQYHTSAKSINYIINLLGVSIFLIILLSSGIIFVIVGGLFVSLLATMSARIDDTLNKLEERILILNPDKD